MVSVIVYKVSCTVSSKVGIWQVTLRLETVWAVPAKVVRSKLAVPEVTAFRRFARVSVRKDVSDPLSNMTVYEAS